MSKPIQISEHQQALSKYFDELLLENNPSDQIESEKKNHYDWKAHPFKALLIDIQGLQLAIPTHLIKSIFIWSEPTEKKEERKPHWYLGHYKTAQYDFNIADLRKIILPSKLLSASDPAEFIITIANQKWGLGCNKINNVVTMLPKTITWRKEALNRPWLAGIVVDKKYSILDIEALLEQLEVEFNNL